MSPSEALRDRPHFTPRLFRNLLWATVDLYAAALMLYFALRLAVGDQFAPVALISTFLHWLLLPALFMLPLAVWRRRWPVAAMLGAGAAAFGWLFGPLFTSQASVASGDRALTFMTYNVHSAPAGRLVGVLRASGADVIGMQELEPAQADAIQRDLSDIYPHQVLYGDGVPGKGLLSRYPITEHTLFHLQNEFIPHLRATLDVDGEPLTVIIAHPPPPQITGPNPLAAGDIAALAVQATAGGATVMLGDFNATDQSDNYALLTRAGLTDAFRAAGWGFGVTWPNGQAFGVTLPPLVRIDYIWYTHPLCAQEAWVGADAGSDHLPVLARLALF